MKNSTTSIEEVFLRNEKIRLRFRSPPHTDQCRIFGVSTSYFEIISMLFLDSSSPSLSSTFSHMASWGGEFERQSNAKILIILHHGFSVVTLLLGRDLLTMHAIMMANKHVAQC